MKFEDFSLFEAVTILGYGVEGKSSAQFLQTKFPDKEFVVVEQIDTPLPTPAKKMVFVISPGINRQTLCANIPKNQQTSNTELFFENLTNNQWLKTIGVSGSKGKSTTTKFCTEFLQNAGYTATMGGNMGTPLLDLLGTIDNYDFAVCELSSFQLEYLAVSPKYALFLNLFPGEHSQRHPHPTKYLQAKSNLWLGRKRSAQYLVVPTDEAKHIAVANHSRLNTFLSYPFPTKFFAEDSVFGATHWRQNFGTVGALSKILHVHEPAAALQKTIDNFKGLPHRMELHSEKGGYKFYDDSISTNPKASVACINWFGENLGAIVIGGRTSQPADIIIEALQAKAPQAFLWLPDSENITDIQTVCKQLNFPPDQIIQGQDFTELLAKGLSLVSKNTAIVLSPGGKSFDRFPNFKERGNAWKESVENI